MALPSILRRVDELLLIKELNARLFDHSVREDLLHMAVSTPSSAIEYDYERLELLGEYSDFIMRVPYHLHDDTR